MPLSQAEKTQAEKTQAEKTQAAKPAESKPAAKPAAEAPAKTASLASPGGSAKVQLASLKDQADAQATWNRLQKKFPEQIGRAHVCTPVTNAHLVCRLLLAKKKQK